MQKSAEIEAVVRRFLASRIANDMEAMRSLHSSSEHLRVIGSDRDQWHQGREAVLPTGGGGDDPEVWRVTDSKILKIEAFEDGNVGWAAVEQERTLVGGQTAVMRMTMVLRLEASVWKLVQIHFSLPVSDEEFLGVELTNTLSNLLTAVDNESGSRTMDATGLSTATVMFTDVVDSTALSQSLGDKPWSDLISRHFDEVQTIIEGEAGIPVKTLGDGGMYVFPSATSALHAAKAIQSAISTEEGGLRVRIGIHTGDVIPSQDDYLGLTVNKAARVAAAADGDQVLVSATTADMVNASEFEFGNPITAELKGIEGVHTLRPLLWQND
jgi:adenylate cyclase